MSRHRMSAGDAAWLHMDRPLNRMIVNSVMWFDEPLDWGSVRTLLEHRLIARFPRFSQRVVELPALAWWQDVDAFDIEPHLKHAALPAPGGRRELESYVSGLLHEALPVDRPLWEMHFIDGFNRRGSAIVVRVHHCIADGMALARVMMSLTDDPIHAARADVTDINHRHRGGVVRNLIQLGESLGDDLLHPSHLGRQINGGLSATNALLHVAALKGDAETSLRGRVDLHKSVAWTDPVRLATVRDAAHRAGATVNDIVLAAIGGALRNHLIREDGVAPDVCAVVPVNLRLPGQPLPAELGNQSGMVFLNLPLSIENPAERLVETKRRADAIKHSPESVVTFAVLDLMGRTPYGVEQIFVDVFARKASLVITNVPGPTVAVTLAGRQLRGTIGWPPEPGDVGLGLSIISYDGELTIGLMCDEKLVHSPRALLADIADELDALISGRTLELAETRSVTLSV